MNFVDSGFMDEIQIYFIGYLPDVTLFHYDSSRFIYVNTCYYHRLNGYRAALLAQSILTKLNTEQGRMRTNEPSKT